MTSTSQPYARRLATRIHRDFPAAVVVTAAMITLTYTLWLRFGTLDPDSADIGGGPIGALAGGVVGAVFAILDVGRCGLRTALPRWSVVAALTWLGLIALFGARDGLDPLLPLAALVLAVFVLVPVAAALGLGCAVHAARRDRS